MHKSHILISILLSFIFLPNPVWAESSENQAKAAQTPLAKNPETQYFSFPLNQNLNGNFGPKNQTQYALTLSPVLPWSCTQNFDCIIRPVLSFYHQPAIQPSSGMINGWGDLNLGAFLSPKISSHLIGGLGPNLIIPVATNQAFGSGKWSIGPQFALIYMPSKWVLGFLSSQVWSVAGDPMRRKVNQFSFQYFISYHLPKGWYVTSQPTLTANWEAPGKQQWTLPFGLGLGRTFTIARQLMNISLQGYYNAAYPTDIAYTNTPARWVIECNLGWLFTRSTSE